MSPKCFGDGASRILSATAAIFSGVRTVFSFSRFGLSMGGCQFLSLPSQDNEHTELTLLLFCQNPYAIFAHFLQHYHDFQSNIAIFPCAFQACTQPHSFSGGILTDYTLSLKFSASWQSNSGYFLTRKEILSLFICPFC